MNKKIVYVDSTKIRRSIDVDFNIIHARTVDGFAPKWYIPKKEIWIEKRLKDETEFLITVDALESKLSERYTNQVVRQKIAKQLTQKPQPEFVAFTYGKYRKFGFIVREVDGGIVRKFFDPLFVIGGHYMIYPYIPSGELWLDKKMDSKELKYSLIHETVECMLMQKTALRMI